MSNLGQANRHSTRRDPDFGRIKVDVSNTAFWEGKEYRTSYEFSISDTQVFKFVSPVDFILQKQELTSDNNGVKFTAYRASQGVEGGTFSEAIPIYKVNSMSETPSVPNQVSITSGGSFTPNSGETSVETIRLRVSNASGQRSTITGTVGDERGLPAGTYYLVLENITGSGSATGVYDLKWEERE